MQICKKMQQKPITKTNFIILTFQLRIYIGLIVTLVLAFKYLSDYLLIGILLLIVYFTPNIVALVLSYKRIKSFRIWYLAATALTIIFCLMINVMPLAKACFEILINVCLFTYKYIDKNFH